MDDLRDILKNYPAECQPARIEPLGSAGGLSGARFWRLVAPRGALVLRCWPIEHPLPERLAFIHAVLRHATGKGMTILPVPISTTSGETFVRHAGRLWEISPWMPGAADYDRSPGREKLCGAMTALARFHVAVADFPIPLPHATSSVSAPAVVNRLTRLRELQSGGGEVLVRAIVDSIWPELAPLAREYVDMLPRVVPRAVAQLVPLAEVRLPLQVCIRDVWHDHILFEGDSVTGIVDFGAIEVDTPAIDVARLLGSLVGEEEVGWRAGLTAYGSVSPQSEFALQAVRALDVAGNVLALANWVRWVYVNARQFENESAIVERFRRTLSRLRVFANPLRQ